MTLQFTVAVVAALSAAAPACSARSSLEPQSKFELECRALGGHIVAVDAGQLCMVDECDNEAEP